MSPSVFLFAAAALAVLLCASVFRVGAIIYWSVKVARAGLMPWSRFRCWALVSDILGCVALFLGTYGLLLIGYALQ